MIISRVQEAKQMQYKDTDSVRLSDDERSVVIIDQTLLPNKTVYLTLSELDELCEAIYRLRVRGAPAIGIFAGYALYVRGLRISDETDDKLSFFKRLEAEAAELTASRPTAVNLSWAVKRVLSVARGLPPAEAVSAMRAEAKAIHEEDIDTCLKISQFGLTLIKDGDTVLTHCNAGALATSRYGTGLGALLLGAERGMKLHAYVDETRPLLQGARLTAYELDRAGVDVTLICDNMAGLVMKQGRINACFVGCDRVAANGDTANKIGTSSAAVNAKYYGVPFYVFCPISTIDPDCASGDDIVIEERHSDEITSLFFKENTAPKGIKTYNPAFDVTDHSLITAFITEKGIIRPPFNMKKLKG